MNKEIIKDAIGKASYLSYHWQQLTFEQLQKEMYEICVLSNKALDELKTEEI